MSRTGKKLIQVPEKVKVKLDNGVFFAEGPLGKESVSVNPLLGVQVTDKTVLVTRSAETKIARSLHGMMRALLANAIFGVSTGFQKKLEINGVGYRAEVQGNVLKLSLGFSHPVEYLIPTGIKITLQDQTKILISGSNKELVGRVADHIRGYRPPEPYKGKGIKYSDEHIIRKVGKAAAATTGAGAGGK